MMFLAQKIHGNPSFIFTLIQKFNKPNQEPIYPDHDIIIMSDEAHRRQYGVFASNMTALLPTASRSGGARPREDGAEKDGFVFV